MPLVRFVEARPPSVAKAP